VLGLKRIHAAAKPNFSYDDLYYFNKRFFHIDSVRETIPHRQELLNPSLPKYLTHLIKVFC